MRKPKFKVARGIDAAMQMEPPFDFEGVTMRVFPLRADVQTVQRFCDRSLNICPDDVGVFRAFLPYVYLMVLDYGRMAVEAANLGWIAQREIAFSIPMEWYRVDAAGRWSFQDWAYTSPFIFVDNELSMATGREVYGWPKIIASLDPEIPTWMQSPALGPRYATASSMVFPEMYAGKRQEPRTFLEVTGEPPISALGWPAIRTNPLLPWVALPNAIRSSAALVRDWSRVLSGMGLLTAQPGADPANWLSMLQRAGSMLDPRRPSIYYNTVNLKQFRSADAPELVCYQAITNARMVVTDVNGGGALGDLRVAAGDASGGYRVLLHRWQALPIIESLGLEVSRQWRGDRADVAELRPVFPFWLEVDMRYPTAETLAWRTATTGWRHDDAPCKAPPDDPPRYNTASSGALQAVAGPFDYPSMTVRVLPLLADPKKLSEVIADYQSEILASHGVEAEPWGSHVYLVAGSYGEMASATDGVGSFAERDLVFYVPVRWYRRTPEGRELASVALVPVFGYADSTTAAITASEVNGIPTLRARIESPPDDWMADAGPSEGTPQSMLRLVSQVLPVLGQGVGAEERVVVEIAESDAAREAEPTAARFVANEWARTLRDQVRARTQPGTAERLADARTLALEVLAHRRPLNVVTLKQFRDAEDPDRACYQAVVEVERVLERIYDLREIEGLVTVGVHAYGSQPIVDALGLVVKSSSLEGETRVDRLEAVRPFWAKVAMHERLGRTLFHRVVEDEWIAAEQQPARYFDPSGAGPKLGRGLERIVGQGLPQRLAQQAADWLASGDARPLAEEAARAAVESVDPQTILGSILSREWEHWGEPRWQKAERRLTQELSAMAASPTRPIGAAVCARVRAEIAELRKAGRLAVDVDALEAGIVADLEREAAARDAAFAGALDPTRGAAEPLGISHRGAPAEAARGEAGAGRFEELLREVVQRLARAWQKPDVCVRRDAAGPPREQDTYFPADECWRDDDGAWYVGYPQRA